MKNIKLYLAIALSIFPIIGSSQEWNYQKVIDDFSDNVIQKAYVNNEDNNGYMMVSCTNNSSIDVIFSIGQYEYLGNQVHKMRYRIDKNDTINAEGRSSTEGTAVFLVDYYIHEFIPRLIDGSSLAFEVTDYKGTPHKTRFNLNGSSKALSPILDSCQKGMQKAEAAKNRADSKFTELQSRNLKSEVKYFENSVLTAFNRILNNKRKDLKKESSAKKCVILIKGSEGLENPSYQGDELVCYLAREALLNSASYLKNKISSELQYELTLIIDGSKHPYYRGLSSMKYEQVNN